MGKRADTPGASEPPEAEDGESASAPRDGAAESGADQGAPEPAGTAPAEGAPSEEGTSDGPPSAAPPPAPPRSRRRRVLKGVAIGTSLLLVATAGVAYALYRKLDGNIRTDRTTARILDDYESQRPKRAAVSYDALNILLIGSDDRSGANAEYGGDEGSQRSDTTILLHLSADRKNATAVSIPRDLMVDIPACRDEEGDETRAQRAQFNWAFQFGGAACTIRTVEIMTGIRIDHHLIVDFTGFKKMVDAVDGVDICLPEPARDTDARLDLPAGRQTLDGEQALAFVRARKGIGDGSDTQRMERQQQFLASLVGKVQSKGILFSPTKLYSVMDAATSSLIADEGLDSLGELYKLARSVEKTPTENVVFLTVPREPYVLDPNRDQLVQPDADELFSALREDRAVRVAEPETVQAAEGAAADGTRTMTEGTAARTPPATASDSPETPASAASSPAAPPSSGASPGPSASSSSSAPSSSSKPGQGPADSEPGFPGTTADTDICGTSGE
ncbi:LCP family protein [Streptomyces capparidis]